MLLRMLNIRVFFCKFPPVCYGYDQFSDNDSIKDNMMHIHKNWADFVLCIELLII